MAARRRRSRNRFLENLGGLPRSTMLTFGLALLLLLASVGIVGATLARRGSAEQAIENPTPEPTAFVAIVETPAPSFAPTATRPASTTRTAAASTAPRATANTAGTPLGAGPGRAARGIAGSMAVSLGGTLPPPEVAAAPPSTQPGAGQSQTSLPTATAAVIPTPTPIRSTGGGSTGSGSSGSGSSGSGSGSGSSGGGSVYTPPTPTPYIAPPTPTRVPPTPTALPTPTPGLPVAVLPGPGSKTYSYNLTFSQSAPLTPPTGAQAWVTTWRTFTLDDVNALKAALGMTGAVEQNGGGFKVTTPGTLLINNTLGTISYTAPGGTASSSVSALALPTITALTPVAEPSASPKASSTPAPANTPAPSAKPSSSPSGTPARPSNTPGPASPTVPKLDDPEALAAAKAWLTKAGIMPADADAGKVTRPTTDQVVVTYHPKTPGTLVPQDPMIQVKLGLDGTVREVYHRWPTNLVPREAATRDLAAAWSDVVTGGGYLEVDQTIPQDLPANTVFKGTAVVAQVALGWAPGSDGKTNYLLPLYVFEGSVTLTNPPAGQPATVPFRVYISATVAP